ncbi:MAG TPA: N-6 DNA methylase, partial [Casimicrobium sp.]|nr:N-6 DNA methylase [Casimicrobium sp.]
MTPDEFISHWSPGGGGYGMSERAGAQPHFIGLCALLGVDAPNDAANYTFELGTRKIDQKRGFADVFKRGCFGWEYKAPGGDLTAALRQLKDYANALDNPPLLIVSDRLAFEIHTQFTGRPTETYRISLKHLGDPAQRDILRRAFVDPASFQPKRTNRDITEEAAKAFADVAERMRHERREPPERVAHFLTQCLFCFFAEDVGLLPERLFEKLVAKQITPEKLRGALIELFEKMQRGGLFGMEDIPWFNGGLFQKIDVPMITPMDVAALKTASQLNWSAIDVAIFGTLFERGLDPKKRSQLGAHYTDPATIMRIVTPVVERPLRAEWALVRDDIAKLTSKSKKHGDAAATKAKAALIKFLDRLASYRVLDPACGSGNFLYLALKTLKDIEHSVHVEAEALGVERPLDLVTSPANVLGIELNEYAAELARVTVWIGELQWRLQHGYPFKQNPVLEPLDHIECRDALLTPRSGRTDMEEATWPRADAVVGNPPFVGDKKMRSELGDEYTETLRKVYAGRVPGGADLVTYWFEKAGAAIASGDLKYAGLVSTNSIRGGKNRTVLDSIVQSSRIFEAWSDQPWVNDGAAVRVSLVAFGIGDNAIRLDGMPADRIRADLTPDTIATGADMTDVPRLSDTRSTCFVGTSKKASFDIDGIVARRWLREPNVHGESNAQVLAHYLNGADIARRPSDTWIVDFGEKRTLSDAKLFEKPYQHCETVVLPEKESVRNQAELAKWWLHARPAPDMRVAIKPLPRFIATSIVAKWRLWSWQHPVVLPSHACAVVARADDATFGILHSRFHELWSLRLGTSLEDRPRYTPTTCFETFPFPAGLTPLDTRDQQTETLEDGAVIPATRSAASAGLVASQEREGVACWPPENDSDNRQCHRVVGDESRCPETNKPLDTSGDGGNSQTHDVPRVNAISIARAAKRLNDLRERWLNPPEWTE